jgi:predicted lysophospholipase L1 biosynthesis ABC-type transport system permease subunit
MKKVFAVLAVGVFAGLGLSAAQQQAPATEETTITGEVIDVGCGKGKGHEDCATTCVRDGKSAAGIKTTDGVYTIVGTYAANKNAKLVEFVAKDVQARGVVTKDKDGKLTINVSAIALAK